MPLLSPNQNQVKLTKLHTKMYTILCGAVRTTRAGIIGGSAGAWSEMVPVYIRSQHVINTSPIHTFCLLISMSILLQTFQISTEIIKMALSRVHTSSKATLSFCFNSHFKDGPVLAGTRMSPFRILLELRVMEVVVTTGAIWRAKLQSNRRHQQTSTQFLFTGRMPCLSPNQQRQSKATDPTTFLPLNKCRLKHTLVGFVVFDLIPRSIMVTSSNATLK